MSNLECGKQRWQQCLCQEFDGHRSPFKPWIWKSAAFVRLSDAYPYVEKRRRSRLLGNTFFEVSVRHITQNPGLTILHRIITEPDSNRIAIRPSKQKAATPHLESTILPERSATESNLRTVREACAHSHFTRGPLLQAPFSAFLKNGSHSPILPRLDTFSQNLLYSSSRTPHPTQYRITGLS